MAGLAASRLRHDRLKGLDKDFNEYALLRQGDLLAVPRKGHGGY